MFLIRVRNDLWWNFDIKKHFQRVKTIRLSTIMIFLKKKIFNFFWGVEGKINQKICSIDDVKSPENFILGIYSVAKWLIWGALTNFCKKVKFWRPYLSLKHFSYPPVNIHIIQITETDFILHCKIKIWYLPFADQLQTWHSPISPNTKHQRVLSHADLWKMLLAVWVHDVLNYY